MTATILDGRDLAAKLREELSVEAAAFQQEHGYKPGLAVVLVGEDTASQTYVRMKKRACDEVGLESEALSHMLPTDTSQEDLEALLHDLNADERVHGILVQLPLPDHIDEERILALVDLDKDVDGFHPVNIGKLAQKGRQPTFTPATPTGIMYLLEKTGIDLSGKSAVVIGRSNIVGMPTALMLIERNATVTVAHSRTTNTKELVQAADVIIAAVGIAEYVKADWVKPGAVVIDVGVNRVDDPDARRGYRLVGDVDFDGAKEVAGWITPVPGGVGPFTIAMLLQNTIKAAKLQAQGKNAS